MADNIKYDSSSLQRWARDLSDVSSALANAKATLNRVDTSDFWWGKVKVKSSLNLRDAGTNYALGSGRDAIKDIKRALGDYETRVSRLSGKVSDAVERFDDTESCVGSVVSAAGSGSIWEKLAHMIDYIGKYPGSFRDWSSDMYDDVQDMLNKIGMGSINFMDTVAKTGLLSPAFALVSWGSTLIEKNAGYIETKAEMQAKGEYDFTPEKWKNDDNLLKEHWQSDSKGKTTDREMTFMEVGVEFTKDVAISHLETKGEAKYASGEASLDFVYSETKASLNAGLYGTSVDENGKVTYHIEPGVAAEFEQSIGLIKTEASGMVGTENFNLNGKAEFSALNANAKGDFQAGFVDGDLRLHGGLSAEANLVEVGGEVGVEIAGVNTKAVGELTVGIGAHAEAGYYDGTFVLDVGASLGVGGSLRLEVDIGDAVDNAVDAWNGMCESAVDFFEGAGDWWSSLW